MQNLSFSYETEYNSYAGVWYVGLSLQKIFVYCICVGYSACVYLSPFFLRAVVNRKTLKLAKHWPKTETKGRWEIENIHFCLTAHTGPEQNGTKEIGRQITLWRSF